MNLYQKVLGALFLVAVVGTGGYLIMQNNNQPASLTDSQNVSQGQPVGGTNTPEFEVQVEIATTQEVTYTDAGFTPSILNIKTGDTVTFKNQSSGNMWVGSAMHPTHMVYGGIALAQHCPDLENNDFDQCQNGAPEASWNFTFTKAGSWGYHNHSNATHFGKIIVE